MRTLLLLASLTLIAAPVAAGDEDLFRAADGESWGFIDASGDWAIEPRFDDVQHFASGRAAAFDGDSWGIIDGSGEWVAGPGRDSLGQITMAEKYTFPEPPYSVFRDGHALACEAMEGCDLIDRDGDTVIAGDDFRELQRPAEGLLAFQPDNGLMDAVYGYMDLDGDVVIEDQFDDAGFFREGRAPVAAGFNEWGYIDTSGEVVIAKEYRDAGAFGDGLAPVQVDMREWQYIDRDGDTAIAGPFEDATPFQDGVALVTDGETGDEQFIDTEGEPVLAEITDRDDLCHIEPFRNGLAHALLADPDDGCGAIAVETQYDRLFAAHADRAYFDLDGEVVWREGQ